MPSSKLLEDITIGENASIEEAFRRLNSNKQGIVFVVASSRRVTGCLTDGDIRRQLLVKDDISVAVSTFMNGAFQSVTPDAPREHVLKLLDHRVRVVPVLDAEGRLVNIHTRDSFELQEEAEVYARARAPARVSFGGGGSDVTYYFFDQGGVILSTAISKYAHAVLRRRHDPSIRIYSYDLDQTVGAASLADFKFDGCLDLVKAVVRLVEPGYGFELELNTDFPVGSGLGGSATLAVAIIGCFNEFRRDPWTRHQIAEMAFQAERLHLNLPGGWQDQYAAVFGGINYMEFSARENVIVPLRLESRVLREIEASMVLCYTGKSHNSGDIHVDQKRQTQASQSAQAALQRQKGLTEAMKSHLLRGDVFAYGRLLDQAWRAKRETSTLVSAPDLDAIYDLAMANGAWGGKLLGAGGGGYFMFFVPPFDRYRLTKALEARGLACERVLLDDGGLVSWRMRAHDCEALS
jgi:D-glycero-alpha-D-manno-heptose-7-phosphate kinase